MVMQAYVETLYVSKHRCEQLCFYGLTVRQVHQCTPRVCCICLFITWHVFDFFTGGRKIRKIKNFKKRKKA